MNSFESASNAALDMLHAYRHLGHAAVGQPASTRYDLSQVREILRQAISKLDDVLADAAAFKESR